MSDSFLISKKKMIVLKVVIDIVFYLYKKLLFVFKIWMIVNINVVLDMICEFYNYIEVKMI